MCYILTGKDIPRCTKQYLSSDMYGPSYWGDILGPLWPVRIASGPYGLGRDYMGPKWPLEGTLGPLMASGELVNHGLGP